VYDRSAAEINLASVLSYVLAAESIHEQVKLHVETDPMNINLTRFDSAAATRSFGDICISVNHRRITYYPPNPAGQCECIIRLVDSKCLAKLASNVPLARQDPSRDFY